MRYRDIPNSDLHVSALCLGTAQLGAGVTEAQSFEILDQFVEAGGNFIDTARAYAIWVAGGEGRSEEILGKWLKDRGYRHNIAVATKGAHPSWEAMNVPRLRRDEIIEDCDNSLRALGLDCIPLYWLHRDDTNRPISDIFETMESLREAGKIRYYGFSNWSTARMEEALRYADDSQLTGFVANQPMWSYAEINPEGQPDPTAYYMDTAMKCFHQRTKLPVIPYTSQAKGFFTRWAEDGLENLPASLRQAYENETNHTRYLKIKSLAEDMGCSITELAIAWLTSQPDFVTIPIVWSSQVSHLREILKAGDLALSPEMVHSLS